MRFNEILVKIGSVAKGKILAIKNKLTRTTSNQKKLSLIIVQQKTINKKVLISPHLAMFINKSWLTNVKKQLEIFMIIRNHSVWINF